MDVTAMADTDATDVMAEADTDVMEVIMDMDTDMVPHRHLLPRLHTAIKRTKNKL